MAKLQAWHGPAAIAHLRLKTNFNTSGLQSIAHLPATIAHQEAILSITCETEAPRDVVQAEGPLSCLQGVLQARHAPAATTDLCSSVEACICWRWS